MTPTPSPRPASPWLDSRRCLIVAAILAIPPAFAAPAPGAEPDSTQVSASALAETGFENVTVDPGRGIAYENRRWRHSAEARGHARVVRCGGAAEVHIRADGSREPHGYDELMVPPCPPVLVFERRLGMVAAAITDTGGGVPAALRFPSDRGFPPEPSGPLLIPTSHSVDLELEPLFSYELGRIFDPVLIRFELQPMVRYNPWPGARAMASLVIPVRNDFAIDALHPDIDRTRPGPTTLEQFGWLRGVALMSATAGLFGENRYGMSVGVARPLAGGAFLLDAQADLSGYIAFPAAGAEYSAPELWTGFAAVTWRPPLLDLGVRLKAARFLYGDRGGELELRRSMGDLDVSFFFQRSAGLNVHGVRLLVPLPPMVRPTGRSVRVLPAERLPLDYRDEATPVGRSLSGVASREDFLRQLSMPGLSANAGRYRAALGGGERKHGSAAPNWVSLTGMTGFIDTPWCGVIGDREVEVGYNQIPKAVAYDHRGTHRNDVYYAAVGFLPRFEAGLRWTVIPGLKSFSDIIPDSRLTDSDRMLSGRVSLIEPKPGRPGLAIGIEDALGTRRFHSTYAVAGIPFEYLRLHSRVSVGYAPDVVTASRHTLHGAFGAIEVSPWRSVAASVEYDTEKWNTALGFDLGFGLRARTALLDGRHVSAGAGWYIAL